MKDYSKVTEKEIEELEKELETVGKMTFKKVAIVVVMSIMMSFFIYTIFDKVLLT